MKLDERFTAILNACNTACIICELLPSTDLVYELEDLLVKQFIMLKDIIDEIKPYSGQYDAFMEKCERLVKQCVKLDKVKNPRHTTLADDI